jgi:hypothetical protein
MDIYIKIIFNLKNIYLIFNFFNSYDSMGYIYLNIIYIYRIKFSHNACVYSSVSFILLYYLQITL